MRDILQKWRKRSATLLFVLFSVCGATAYARNSEPLRIDAGDAAQVLAEELAAGARSAESTLRALGPEVERALRSIREGVDFQFIGFSAHSQIRSLYSLAENSAPAEGRRFLAKLHHEAAKNSPAAAIDPELLSISQGFSASDLAKPLSFAPISSLTPAALDAQLSAAVEKAITLLADYTAPDGLGSATATLKRWLNLSEGVVETSVARAHSRRDALYNIVSAHVPPPPVEIAMEQVLLDTMKDSPALSLDEEAVRTLRELASEPLPANRANYAASIDRLQTLVAEARHLGPKAKAAMKARTGSEYLNVLGQTVAANGVEAAAAARPGDFEVFRDAHASYSSESMEPRDPATSGGGAPAAKPRPGNVIAGPPVPRNYRIAVFSARAGRGVSVGGPISSEAGPVTKAFWVPSTQDRLFGRFILLTITAEGKQSVTASPFLFADSFEAAVATLWGNFGSEAEFRDGEITILMSMDPNSPIWMEVNELRAEAIELERKINERNGNFNDASDDDYLSDFNRFLIELMLEDLYLQIKQKTIYLPRGIVIHPALIGKHLSWSVARVDFWFNNLPAAFGEAWVVSGLDGLPVGDLGIDANGRPRHASTWQFFERENEVSTEIAQPAAKLAVRSRNLGSRDPFASPNHFSMSLFALGDTPPTPSAQRVEDSVFSLPEEEGKIQPLLDWLSANHPDFIRLNDYSEALSILRWLDNTSVALAILDADGPEAAIPTPDRIDIGTVGPSVGPKP